MPKIVGFDPDPMIPDSLVLGTGDLLVELDDGTVEQRPIVDDIDLAAQGITADEMRPKDIARPKPTKSFANPLVGNPLAMPAPGSVQGDGQGVLATAGRVTRPPGLHAPGESDAWLPAGVRSVDDSAPNDDANKIAGALSGQTGMAPEAFGGSVAPSPPLPRAGQQGGPPLSLRPGSQSVGSRPPSQGMIPVQRTGALPPGMAAEQMGAMQAQHMDERSAFELARERIAQGGIKASDDALRAAAQRQGDADALLREAEQRQARLEQERDEVADMDLRKDLYSGVGGGIAAVMHVLGSALLGATGSDSGLKMMDSYISKHINQNLARRNSKLAALRDKLGSTTQTIAAAKAEYYKGAAELVQQMSKLEQWKQYQEMTPVLLEQLESKQQEQEQKFQREALGKTTEKLVSPGAANPQDVQKFGKDYRAQEQSMRAVRNVMDSIGAVWDPTTKQIVNREEVLREGFEGAGSGLTKFVPDSVAKWYYDVTDSKQGQQVLGAKKVIAYALARQMDPGGRLSDKDIELFMSAANMDTEEGYLTALENLLRSEGQDRSSIMATYGTPAVQQFFNERAARTGDGRDWRNLDQVSPGGARKATIEDKNLMSGAPAQEAGHGAPLGQDDLPTRRPTNPGQEMPAKRTRVDIGEVRSMLEQRLGPEAARVLAAQVSHETGKGNTFGYNLGGIKARDGEAYQLLGTNEVINGETQRVREPFASFDSLEGGIEAYLGLLERRYPDALAAASRGDTRGFVRELKKKGYFTADEDGYYDAFMRHYGGQ